MQEILEKLNEEQRLAVEHEGSPLLILAGAGSGKTRVITTKIAYLISQKNVNPYSILSVTFTKKAANEMKERAILLEPRAENAQIKTFHSFGSWFLRRFYEDAGLDSSFIVYDDNDSAILLRKAVPSLSVKEAKVAAKQIALAKDYFLLPSDDLSFISNGYNQKFDLNEVYEKYQNRLKATGNVDFGDLIMLPALIMDSSLEIQQYIHNRFQVIMVDEYQDSNIAQYKLLQKLSGVEKQNSSYVCVVGDDDQSIYHFRGAEVQNILSFPKKFPNTQIIKLQTNYRSTAKILHAADTVVSKNEKRLGKTLVAAKGDGGMPVLAFLGDQNEETIYISNMIKKSVEKGGKYSDWAILYRTNAQSLNFEKSFPRQKIPYKVVGSLKFYDREEIKDILSYLSLFLNNKDEISFRRVINKPARGLGEKTQDKIIDFARIVKEDGTTGYKNLIEKTNELTASFSKKAGEGAKSFVNLFNQMNDFLALNSQENSQNLQNSENNEKKLSDFIEKFVHDSGLYDYHKAGDEIDGTQREQNLLELINSASNYSCDLESLTLFLDSINLDRTLDLQNEIIDDDCVTLITLHNTKGLEYNKVVITGLEEGVFPRNGKDGFELEEERRLFYVGITRAKDELFVTSVAKRNLYGRYEYMRPSPFLYESKAAFSIIGEVPVEFRKPKEKQNWAKSLDQKSFSQNFDTKTALLMDKWKKGIKIYHDDYGYGVIINTKYENSEFLIEVQFENTSKKVFFPKYQGNSLMIVK